MDKKVEFYDTTLRDGNQSLWGATGFPTAQVLWLAPFLDNVGYKAIEIGISIHFKMYATVHKENPWERLRLIRKTFKNTDLRWGGGLRSFITFKVAPESVMQLFAKLLGNYGMDSCWLVDGLHDLNHIHKVAKWLKDGGVKDVIVALCYAIGPIYTDEFYAQKARQIAEIPYVDALYIKDMGGLLTPERTRTLVPTVLQNSLGKRVEIHAHCNTSLAALCLLEAVKLGVKVVHTAIPPLAYGTSHPSVFNIMDNLESMGYSHRLDRQMLQEVQKRLDFIAEKEKRPTGQVLEYDYSYFKHQLPGGMMGTLRRQLAEVKCEHLMDKVLEEIERVQKELGYPPMVSPFSQFVATQATYNVITGDRYKVISNEIIEYVLGFRGEPPAPIDANVKDKMLGSVKAREIERKGPPHESLSELRRKLGIGPNISDEEFLLRYSFSEQIINDMHAAGPIRTETSLLPIVINQDWSK